MPALIIALVIGLTVAAGSGVAYAGHDALPGDALYPVKQAVETFQVGLAQGSEGKAEVHLAIADAKLREVEHLQAKQAGSEELAKAAERLALHQQATEDALQDAAVAGKDVDKIVGLLKANSERQQATLQRVLDNAPDQAKGALEHALQMSQHGLQNAIAHQTGSGKPEAAGKPEGVGRPHGVGKPAGVGRPQ